jgi:hypothetical protein
MLQSLNGEEFKPVTSSAEIAEILASVPNMDGIYNSSPGNLDENISASPENFKREKNRH